MACARSCTTRPPTILGFRLGLAALNCLLGVSVAFGQQDLSAWTAQDHDKAVDAATAAASSPADGNARASLLLELADALAKAASMDQARSVARKAAQAVSIGEGATNSLARQNFATSLGRVGDV